MLGLATKQDSLFKVSYGQNLSLELKTLLANARYTSQAMDLQLSLGLVTYGYEGFVAELSDVYVEAESEMQGTTLLNTNLKLQANAKAEFTKNEIFFSSPLSASLLYRNTDASLSSSAEFLNLNSSFTTMPLFARFSYQSYKQTSQLQVELDYEDKLAIRSVYDLPSSSEGTFHLTSRWTTSRSPSSPRRLKHMHHLSSRIIKKPQPDWKHLLPILQGRGEHPSFRWESRHRSCLAQGKGGKR